MSQQSLNNYRSPFLSPLTPSNNNPNYATSMNSGHDHHPSHRTGSSMLLPSSTASNTPRQFGMRTNEDHGMPAEATIDVVWNPTQVDLDLQKACTILTQRQLKLSAKWIAELAVGLSSLDIGTTTDGPPFSVRRNPVDTLSSTIPNHLLLNLSSSSSNYPALFQYARTLFDLGDYAMAASMLSVGGNGRHQHPPTTTSSSSSSSYSKASVIETTLTTMPPPIPHLSSYEIYLRSYALYMAGERQKEEQILELQR
jgi:Anaphase promoting complex subunit 8 / Cdc23